MPSQIPPKVLAAQIQAAEKLCNKVRSAYGLARSRGQSMTFGQLETDYSLPLEGFTDEAKLQTIVSNYQLEAIFRRYVSDTPARLEAAAQLAAQPQTKLKVVPQPLCRRLIGNPDIQLWPEQEPVVAAVLDDLYVKDHRLSVIRAGTGAGKTIYACAIIDHLIQDGLIKNFPIPLPHPIVWFTVKNAVEQTRREIALAGYGDMLDKDIFVWPYSAVTSSYGLARLIEEYEGQDPSTGEIITLFKWRPMALSLLVILDEVHCLARETSRRHKAIRAMAECAQEFTVIPTKFIAMSATIAEKVNDGRLITCISGVSYAGQKITWDNFNLMFAGPIGGPQGPGIPSKASVQRMYDALGPIVRQPPYYPWPYRAINSIRFYDFPDAQSKAFYDKAVEDYLERIETLGRDTPNDLALRRIALLQLRKRVAPIRAPMMVDDMVAEVNKGNTALLGCSFVGTIIRAAFLLQDKHGYSRDDYSVIWGGKEDPRPDKILTPEELIALVSQPEITPRQLRQLQKQLDWQEDKLIFGDADDTEHDERHDRLRQLGLIGTQTQAIRQAEIDKYMSGQAKFCLITAQSGGTGLSLPHRDARTGPRVGLFPPMYNGKEAVQLLGRLPRRNSISNTRQYVCMMRDSLEVSHVAPKMDLKLQCLGVETTSKDDLFNILANLTADELRHAQQVSVRTEEQAKLDAMKEESQIIIDTGKDDEEEEED